jgi:plasmid stabilization system protein ParE
MSVRYSALARRELDEGWHWYEHQLAGLGQRFIREVEATVLRVVRFPLLNTKIQPGIHRALVKTFPYMVIYDVDSDGTITVLAIGHQHRKPGYWTSDAL